MTGKRHAALVGVLVLLLISGSLLLGRQASERQERGLTGAPSLVPSAIPSAVPVPIEASFDIKPWTDYPLIAHALGGIDGKDYSNSLDAFKQSYKKGFRVFETDLILTSDNELVARHDWGKYLQPSLPEAEQDIALPRDEFMKYKIYDEYRPLNLQKIVTLLKNKPDTYLITDTKEIDPDVIKAQFELLVQTVAAADESLLDRIIPEIYTHEMYEIVNSIYPFPNQIYSIYLTTEPPQSIIDFVKENQIPVVAMETYQASESFIAALKAADVLPYIYTVNEASELESYRDWGVQGFYTDFLTPQDMPF